MANPITGDFDAVLQVSGLTIDRLLASIHQNAGNVGKPGLPSFPHSVTLRVGDPRPIDGMRGTAWAQLSAPHLELIHGSTDRFWLEVSIRARYRPDAGSTPLPEFIQGTIRAQYRLDNIDPQCWGWRKQASEYLWIRVVGDTVSFTGTAVDDLEVFSIVSAGIDPAVADARITRLARVLLQTRFAATPHKVSSRFRRGSMRSLNVGINQAAVVVPVALGPPPPGARIDSISQNLLDGRDFAIAISQEYIISRIQPLLDDIRAQFRLEFSIDLTSNLDVGVFDVDVLTVHIAWTITLTGATATWVGGKLGFINVSAGVVVIALSGQARTQKAIFNWDFAATQYVLVTFDTNTEQFNAVPLGTPTVGVTGPFGAIVEPFARPRIEQAITDQMKTAVAQVAGVINLKSRREEMVRQLQTIDDLAAAAFTDADYTKNGVVVRGAIRLSPRRAPVHHFDKTAQEDGFTAFESWIPGGRIDVHDWSWTWYAKATPGGTYAGKDRFVLRRPGGTMRSRFGATRDLRRPLPGLDGMGKVCVDVSGVAIHPVTGQLMPKSTGRRCHRYGFDIGLSRPGLRVLVRERAPGPRDPLGPVAEVALIDAGARAAAAAANTLVIYVGDEWRPDMANALRSALAASRRSDAGLLVVVLFRDGRLENPPPELLRQLEEFASDLEAPLMVNEDVLGTWSRALGIEADRGELEWRLVSPTGGTTWMHSGALQTDELRQTLDAYLFPSGPPRESGFDHAIVRGDSVESVIAGISVIGSMVDIEPTCPPPPPGALGIRDVIFVQKDSLSSAAVLRDTIHHGAIDASDDAIVVAIVDGVGDRELEEFRRAHPPELVAVADQEGGFARRFGIRTWPTRVSVNEAGLVTRVDEGAELRDVGHNPAEAS